MIIHGGKPLHGAVIDSHLDHRVAMSFAVAGTICEGENGDPGCRMCKYFLPGILQRPVSLRELKFSVEHS